MKSLKHILALLGLCVAAWSHSAHATDYYINANTGSDSNDGLSEYRPWASFARLQEMTHNTYNNIYLHCASSWREQLNIDNAGGKNYYGVFVTSYGSCNGGLPTIFGSNNITSWTNYSGNIFYATVNENVSQVYANGAFIRPARYPQNGYRTITADYTLQDCPYRSDTFFPFGGGTGFCGAVDSTLPAALQTLGLSPDAVIGASISIQSADYWIDTKTVTSYAGNGLMKLDTIPRYAASTGKGYYLENKLWMLTQPGGWVYDPATKRLYLWLADGSNPTRMGIEATVRDYGLNIRQQSFIQISKVAVKYAAKQGIFLDGVANQLIYGNQIDRSGDGIGVNNASTQATIAANVITNALHDGIKVLHSYNANTFIDGNTFIESGTVAGKAGSPKYVMGAIVTEPPEALHVPAGSNPYVGINGNKIVNSGYIGIQAGIGTDITNNVVTKSCLSLSDCGGIYVHNWQYIPNQSYPKPTNINNNIVDNPPGSVPSTYGIYLDDFTNNAVVNNNTVVGGTAGMLVHLAFNNKVLNNTFYAGDKYQLWLTENLSANYAGATHGNVVEGNTFFGVKNSSSIQFNGEYGNIQFGSFNKNRYSGLYGAIVPAATRYRPDFSLYQSAAAQIEQAYTFPEWQQSGLGVGMDGAGNWLTPLTLNDYSGLFVITQDFIENGTFNTSTAGWTTYHNATDYTGGVSFVAQPSCSNQSACGSVYNASTRTMGGLNSAVFPLANGGIYRLNFDLLSDGPVQPVVVNASNSAPAGLAVNIDSHNTWKHYSYVFTATADVNNALITFNLPPQRRASLDNVSFVRMGGTPNDRSDDSKILLNKSRMQTAIACPFTPSTQCTQYVDLDGVPVIWPVVVPALSSKIIIWANNPFKQ